MTTFPRRFPRLLLSALAAASLLRPALPCRALDLTEGVMMAVPAPGKEPALDGTDGGWDLSGAEPMWVSAQTADRMHAKLALNYDAANLYVYARVSLENGKLVNVNGPADPFWAGDMLELRLCSDPSLPFPLNPQDARVMPSNRVCHMSFWKDTADGKTYFSIAYGGMHGNGKGKVFDPAGSRVAITEGKGEYFVQARIPWSALNVPDGQSPFVPGSRMTAIWGVHWGFENQIAALYTRNPGAFAFLDWGDWGQVEFSAKGGLPPRHGTMEEALAASSRDARVGVPFTVDVAEAGKLSVNIVGEHGEVIRDIAGGREVAPGKVTLYWDGRDQWGFALPPGDYRWGAYFSHGLKARFVGFVGSSGNPPYSTTDGKGGWGGDHGLPSAAAADAGGAYLGWSFAEAQAQIVKLDPDGNLLWRKSPFIQAGTADLHALASNGKYLFAAYDGRHPILSRLDAATGTFVLFGGEAGKGGTVPIAEGRAVAAPEGSLPAREGTNRDGTSPECLGLAATEKEVFASVYSRNLIQVLDVQTGRPTRTLACPFPRGLALDAQGNLYAVSYGAGQPPRVVRFRGTAGEAAPAVDAGLVAPLGVAVDAAGRISVTDEGASQQVKTFSADGKPVRVLGKEGGRPWTGAYLADSYRDPSAIAADPRGGLLVAESSIPKIFDRLDAASGKTVARWFGWPAYGVSNIGDSEDPMVSYYPFEPAGFARARVPAEGKTGLPDAYWDMDKAGQGRMYGMLPYVSTLANGRKYFIDDSNPHTICRIDGDEMVPVGHLDVHFPNDRLRPEDKKSFIEVWIDRNGDRRPEPDEVSVLDAVQGAPLPRVSNYWTSLWMDKAGNAYFGTAANSILKIPADGFETNGAIRWAPDKASYAVPAILPSRLDGAIGGRMGMPGLRTDSHGNVYACLSAVVPALTPALGEKIRKLFPDIPPSQWCAYASDGLAQHMQEGLGHSGESNIAKFVKFGPDGKMAWIAGRKATAAPRPGEMYHFWAMAGMVGDDYVAGASEWGPIYFYTSDGFYVDALMNDPAALPPPGPCTFGSETFSGRIQAFDKLKKVYAYDMGGIYAVDGFDAGMKVEGERRWTGTVRLDKTYGGFDAAAIAAGLRIAPLSGDVSQGGTWAGVPIATLTRGEGALATAQVGYDAGNLYARVHVADATPLQNGADDPDVAFKGGDAVGLDLGPAGDRNGPVLGDVRLLAASIHGQPRLVAMKPLSRQPKQPQQYTTPAAGTKAFDFVGEVPGGKAVLEADPDGKGYTALLTVPRAFLEFPIVPGTPLRGDVEVLLSGTGQRGLQAVSRNWLNSGGRSQTTMVDDIPTEAWLYPQWWGEVSVK